MSVGIVTRYSRHEAAFAAIRVAEWFTRQGRDVSIFSVTDHRVSLDPRWDGQVIPYGTMLFTDWLQQLDWVVMTAVPHPEQIHWCKAHGKKTAIVVLWHELYVEDREALAHTDCLICPSRACFELLKGWGLRNLLCVPWDCGSPFFTKPADYEIGRPRLLLPIWDGNARRTEMTAIDIIGRALYRHPDVEATIAYNSSTVRSKGVRLMKEMQKWFGDRLTLTKGVHPNDRPLLYQQHDLTIWPSHWESLGLVGLTSVAMGTPVMGFNFRPTNEILTESNGVPVRCPREETNDLGLPRVIPDYELMDELLHQAVRDTDYIRQLQVSVLDGAAERRAIFERQLGRVFI